MNEQHSTNSDPSQAQEFGHIKTFARRRGHLSKGQAKAIEEGMPKWGVEYTPNELLNFETAFGREAENWLEIGFGMGETTAELAHNHPKVNYLGVEVYPAGVGALLKRIEERALTNIRVISHDVIDIVHHMIPNDSLSRVLVFFPDPWRKAKHHKRRLIRPDFIEALIPKLKPNGVLHCATDWENYAEQMLEVLSQEPQLTNTSTGFSPRPTERPLTKFENRGIKLGHEVWDLIFRKIPPV